VERARSQALPTANATEMLMALEDSLLILRRHRKMILDSLD